MSPLPKSSAVIVGAGLMGAWHAEAAKRAGASVVGVVDTDRDRAGKLARRFQGARAATSLDEVLGTGTVDVVHICTPTDSHVSLGLAAIAAGCHVLAEKPLAADLGGAEKLFRAAADRDRLLTPVHQFLFQRGALAAERQLESLGALRHLEMEICSAGAERSGDARDAVAVEILPHALAFAAQFCRTSITAGTWDLQRPTAGELIVSATVGTVGVTARVSMRGRPPVNRLRIVAERGTIHLDLFHGFAMVEQPGVSRVMKLARPFLFATRLGLAAAGNLAVRALRAEPAYPGLRELVRRFYAAAAGQEPNPIPMDKSLAVMVVWDLLRRRLAPSEPTHRDLEESGLER